MATKPHDATWEVDTPDEPWTWMTEEIGHIAHKHFGTPQRGPEGYDKYRDERLRLLQQRRQLRKQLSTIPDLAGSDTDDQTDAADPTTQRRNHNSAVAALHGERVGLHTPAARMLFRLSRRQLKWSAW